jgi:hypothetical protein
MLLRGNHEHRPNVCSRSRRAALCIDAGQPRPGALRAPLRARPHGRPPIVPPGLTSHGLRHSHKTWIAEDGIPGILAEQRLGHQVPGMRGLYAHASDRMRDDLMQALQARWQESLKDRAAIYDHSPVPLLDELLAPLRADKRYPTDQTAARKTRRQRTAPDDREKMSSQIPPKSAEHRPGRRAWKDHEELLTWSGIRSGRVELTRLELVTPCLQIGFSACDWGADLVSGLSVSHRSVPLVTQANGTLMARDLGC